MSSTSAPESHHGVNAHETTDVNLRPVVIAGFGLLIILLLSAVAMFGLFDVLQVQEARTSPPANPLAAADAAHVPPAPRLQVHPIKDLQELRKAEQDLLTSYAWKDKNTGVVRIPIARAMELLAARAGAPGAPPQ
ncbi:MAG: hypothetical protein ABI629_10800 [bacterium]